MGDLSKCEKCPIGKYCFGNNANTCTDYATTKAEGAQSSDECLYVIKNNIRHDAYMSIYV